MNFKSILVVIVLLVVAGSAFLLLKGSDSEEPSGMTNGMAGEVQTSADPAAALLIGKGSAQAAEAGRQTVPEQDSVAELPEAVSSEVRVSNEVFAQVVDDQGQGLEGVKVLIRQLSGEEAIEIDRWESSAVVKAETGKDGRVAFEVSSGPFLVKVEESGFVGREIKFPGGTEAGQDLGVWALSRALTLTGRVVGPNGNPVVGARIIAPQDGGFIVIFNGQVESIAETDAQGRFSIDTLKPGAWRLLVNSDSYPDQIFSGGASSETQQVGLLWTLDEGATLRGRLVGRPGSNTEALAVRMDLEAMVNRDTLLEGAADGFPNLKRTADLQPDGTFSIGGLHPETKYRVRLMPKGKGGGILFGDGRSLCEEKTISSSVGVVDLMWATKASFRVLVLDADTSKPVEEYSVNPDDFQYFSAFQGKETHPQGIAEFSGIPPSSKPITIRIQAEGYEPYTVESVEFHTGGMTNLGTIRLKPGVLCNIRVVDGASGKPVKGVRVELTSKHPSDEEETLGIAGLSFSLLGDDSMEQSGKTDEDGLVSLRFMEGTSGHIKARHARFARAEITGVDLSTSQLEPILFELWKGGELKVSVLDANDDPVRGVKVELAAVTKEDAAPAFSLGAGLSGFGRGSSALHRNTNSKGLARFKHVPAGEYRCTVAWPDSNAGVRIVMIADDTEGSESEEPSGQLVTIHEGGSGELTMAAPLRSTLEGIILENGTPLVGARVSVAKAGGSMMFSSMMGGGGDGVRTDRDGHFLLENLNPGEMVITIKHDLRVMDFTDKVRLEGGANEYSARLQVASVSGRVVDLAGQGLEGIRISAEQATEDGPRGMVSASIVMISGDAEGGGMEVTSSMGGGRKPTTTDSQGRFELRGVLPGKPLKIVAAGQELATVRSQEITVSDGSLHSGVKLTMLPGCKLTVQVVDRQGHPVAHALVQLKPVRGNEEDGEEAGSDGPRRTTDSNGVAVFDTLKEVTFNVSAFRLMEGPPENQESTQVTVELLNPKELELTID